ncbi:MAG TPA: precorrin-3B C(17)-methyltransferase [Acidimicrobiales bacterium]|nr:precorrin-3B C(17)-methyltransferase [Acidimicrobiales bacterium]
MTGPATLTVVGLGPGDPRWLLPEARSAIENTTHLVGYQTYLDMVPADLVGDRQLHGSDNRVELDRAGLALDLAAAGERVAVVSSGDPGVFAMAAAVFEAQHAPGAPATWSSVDVVVVPGVTAALAAAARAGAPLGHDFCLLSLSDNLKPWSIIERRIQAAMEADLVLGIYNPVSRHRPTQLATAFDLIRRHRSPATPVVLARDVGRPAEEVVIAELDAVDLGWCDMRTVILVGSSTTQIVPGAGGSSRVFTPRSHPDGRDG